MRNRKFYKRLLLTYLGIVFLYTLIMIGLFFVGAKKYISTRLDTQNRLFLEQYAKTVDTALDMSFNVSKQMFSSSEVQTFLLAKEIDYYNLTMIYRGIHKTLSPFSRFNFFLAIGKSNSDMVISTAGTLKEKEFYQKMNFPFLDSKEHEQYFVGQDAKNLVLKTSSDFYGVTEPMITIIDRQRLLSNIEMLSYVSYPEKGLFPDISELSNGALLVKNGADILIQRNYGIAENKWQGMSEADWKQSGLTGYASYTCALEFGDLSLCYIIPKPTFWEMWTEIISEFGLIYLGLILFGAIGAYFTTRKVYQPVLSVVNQFQENYDISGITDEFAIIRTASEKMTLAKEELEQIIWANKAPLKTKFMRDLLYGLSDQDDIEEKIAKYDLQDFKGPFQLLVIEHINYAKMGERFSENHLIEIRKNIMALYLQLLDQAGIRYEIVELETNRVAILLSRMEYMDIKSDLEELLESFDKDYGIQVLAILGKQAEKLDDLDISYSSALEQLGYRNLLPKNKIILYDKKLEVKPMAYYYPLDVEEGLINYVEQRKEEETHLLLEHILNQNFKHHHMTAETVSLLTFAIIATINRLLNQQFKKVEDVYGEGIILYLELKAAEEEVAFKDKVHSLFQTLLEKLEDHQDYHEDSLAGRLLEYIHANYQTDISLNDVAEAFSITPTYVSMLFKKEYKTNFKDYLNRYKIEQAKEIMKNNKSVKNKELSEAVGFNSVNTFLRLFKKYTGETPGKYMESKR
ncbi:helix-turn-helix domain-containing protein [Clostridiales bacterium COT073_COT-073]|nr:helix-turn-helix domain-containing protein [Clostridiales bacterium COT073_COT-073]